jgi:hypothetical protein
MIAIMRINPRNTAVVFLRIRADIKLLSQFRRVAHPLAFGISKGAVFDS